MADWTRDGASIANSTKTLSQMREHVYFLVREDEDVFSQDEVDRALNVGLRLAHQETNRDPILVSTSTVAGTREYEIPEPLMLNGTARVDAVWIGDEQIASTSYAVLEDDAENDEPENYYVRGVMLGLDPVPDDVYTVQMLYRRDFEELSDDDDTSELNDLCVDAAMYYAAFLLKTIDEEIEQATIFKGMSDEALGRASMLKAGLYRDGTNYGDYGGAE